MLCLPVNSGKGAAVLHGLQAAQAGGYTHVLAMDADGQHPARRDPRVHRGLATCAARRHPRRAAVRRERARAAAAWPAHLELVGQLETLGAGVQDSLFGFRVYPVAPLLGLMQSHRWMRRFDFDPEAAVRLVWAGVPPLNLPAPVRYLSPSEGGVSHFRYLRDNVLLTGMHIRLMVEFVFRLPWLLIRRPRLAVRPE